VLRARKIVSCCMNSLRTIAVNDEEILILFDHVHHQHRLRPTVPDGTALAHGKMNASSA
jgi:hypothetical protein